MDNATAQMWNEIQLWVQARGGNLDRDGDKVFYSIQNGIIRLSPELRGAQIGVGFSIRQERPATGPPTGNGMEVDVSSGDAFAFVNRRIRRFWAASMDDVEFALTAIMSQPAWSDPGAGITVRS